VSERKLNPDDYVGEDACCCLVNREQNRCFHGLISRFIFINEMGRFYLYMAIVVPHLHELSLTSDVRVFQNKTTEEIIHQILEEHQILEDRFEFRDHAKYTPREYCVQYRETNLEFISRLLAEEGMFYYFEFTEEKSILVFGDMFGCHGDIPGSRTIKFAPPGALTEQGEQEHITGFDIADQMITGEVTLRDFNFMIPDHPPTATKSHDIYDVYEFYDYPGYTSGESMDTLRQDIALDRAIMDQHHATGKSTCRRMLPGHTFVLDDHIFEENDSEYIIISTDHLGTQPYVLQELADKSETNTYFNTFKCIPGDRNFKPPRLKKPSVRGIQTAKVTGPKNEDIYVDEYGRIKVQFHWDRKGKRDESSSCWLRVAQPWAGAGWGSMFIPRIDQEVVVNFIDGDPDRPIVTGALYNGFLKPPYDLPQHKTRSTIKTRSTPDPDGLGFNELRFEDKKDEEEIYIHGQKDWNIDILNDKGQHIGRDEKLTVDNDREKEVKHDQQESIGNNKDIKVTKNHTEDIGENSTHSIGKNSDERVGENKTIDIGKNREETIGGESKINISKKSFYSVGDDSRISIEKNLTHTTGEKLTADIGDNAKVSINKNLDVIVSDKTVFTSEDEITFVCGDASIIMKKNGTIQLKGVDVKINASGKLVTRGEKISGN